MAVHHIKQGLKLPLQGEPALTLEDARTPHQVALLAADYVGMKPTMAVEVGAEVLRGQLLFEDKKMPGVRFTSPAAGKVVAINRGERRAFESIVIELNAEEKAGRGKTVKFESFIGQHPSSLDASQIKALLIESGLFTALRARPFARVADPATEPHSIFVNVMDSNPLAADPNVVITGRQDDFERGVTALSKLTKGFVYVCAGPLTKLRLSESSNRIRHEVFTGAHPAGTSGLHIHTLDPVDRHKIVWYLGYQDVIAIGHLFEKGELDPSRVITLAGPPVKKPRHLRTRIGARIADLIADELEAGELRVISGSPLSGRAASGEVKGFLGRYHSQVAVLEEERSRDFIGWLMPGADRFSVLSTYVSKLLPGKKFRLGTSTNGSHRAILPVGMFERVFPFDMLPSYLLRSVYVGDLEMAEQLGVLELDEEDVAVCSFVCPSKLEYGSHLRDVLTSLEKEG
jgi:Na+-transporting NADH:ubiquinone oxidoreductase subunit A